MGACILLCCVCESLGQIPSMCKHTWLMRIRITLSTSTMIHTWVCFCRQFHYSVGAKASDQRSLLRLFKSCWHELALKLSEGVDIWGSVKSYKGAGLGRETPRLHPVLLKTDGLLAQTKLHWTLKLVDRDGVLGGSQREKLLVDSPWTSFWAIFCVRMSEDRRLTSPLNTHSWTGKSCPVLIMGFLLLSSMTSGVDSVFVLALIWDCWFCCCCCCCCVDADLFNLWLLKILLALLLLFVLEAVNVPVAASSSGSSKSSSLLGLLSLRRERTFSPVIF